MELYIITTFGILGLLIGSFLNVVILRYNTGKGINGRSACMTCARTLHWYELVPVFSYVAQGGKCLNCKSSISKQYVLVETATGILFALIAAHILIPFQMVYSASAVLSLIIALASAVMLVIIFVYDMRHKIIPDLFSFAFAFLACAGLALQYQGNLFSYPALLDFLTGPLVAFPFAALWFFSKGEWMGLGDAKLALGMGWFLGLPGALSAFALAFWIGAAVGVTALVIGYYHSKRKRSKVTLKTEVPLAPFLILGFFIVYFFPMDIFHLYTLFSLI
jgi:leader peptidase (prepilin peptidase)/N-methyltransferase